MTLLNQQILKIKQSNRIGLMTHVVVGYPSLEDTVRLVKLMEKAEVDIVELQIPFSDPLADGPTIMKACEKSLENGTKVKDAISIMKRLSKEVSIPLLFMAYYNNIFKYGTEKFIKDAKEAGAQGLIVPDVPIEEEENENFIKYCQKYRIANIRVLSPASTPERLEKNAKVANGFVYFTARQGTTGAKSQLSADLSSNLKRLRQYFSIPIAVGFGISKKEHLEMLKPYADIAVIGSAIIDVINSSKEDEMEEKVGEFIRNLR